MKPLVDSGSVRRLAALIASFGFLLGFTFQPDTPESQGMSSEVLTALQAYSDAFHDNTGLLVLRNDVVVLEHYTGTGNVNKQWAIKSATKSFGAGLLVRALDDGVLTLSDLACTRPDVTVHHVVSMTAGIPKNKYTCDTGFWFEPGEDFAYSDGSANVFGDKLREFYGADLAPLMASALMDPIGVESWSWSSEQLLSSGLSITIRDMIRYGRLWLRGGDWDGVQVLSQSGVALATAPSAPQLRGDYGYLWWVRGSGDPPFYDRYGFQLNPLFPSSAPEDAFLAAGCTRSYILVVPSLQLVAARANGACVSIQNGTTQFTDEARGFVEAVLAAVSACSDGVDNDGNGLTDFPADPGCSDLADTSEASPAVPSAGPLGIVSLALALLGAGLLRIKTQLLAGSHRGAI